MVLHLALMPMVMAAFGGITAAKTIPEISGAWRNREKDDTVALMNNQRDRAYEGFTTALRRYDDNRTLSQQSNNRMLSRAYRDTMATFQHFDNNRTLIHHSNNQLLVELDRGRRLTHAQSTELMRDVLSAWQQERGMFFQQLRLDQRMIISLLVLVAGLMYLLGGYQAAYEHVKQQLAVERVHRNYASTPPQGIYSHGSAREIDTTWWESATWPVLVFVLTWFSFSFNLLGFQSLVDSVLDLPLASAVQVMLLFLLDLIGLIALSVAGFFILTSPFVWYDGKVGPDAWPGIFLIVLVSSVVSHVCAISVTKGVEHWGISDAVSRKIPLRRFIS